MSLMTWNDEMSVGVKVIDEDHKKLMSLVNELHDGIMSGHRAEALVVVLDKLVAYTKTHFAREEEFFAKTGYPSTAAHKKEHEDLLKKAADLQSRAKSGASSILSLETMSFLKNWLAHHILEADKAYGPYLNSKGIH